MSDDFQRQIDELGKPEPAELLIKVQEMRKQLDELEGLINQL